MPGRRPLVDVPFAREMSLTSIISDIAKVPFFPPKIQEQYFLKFFRTKGDYKSELPFCPEYREYLGLFIDLIIEISGQKGDFFWNFQFFLY
jgi:hypothetical protein|tara:strand:- start:192 stop:464 length:273 start_codon:yes stop_codon:yes gene_type:complete